MNSSFSSLDPRIPGVLNNIQQLFDLLNGLQAGVNQAITEGDVTNLTADLANINSLISSLQTALNAVKTSLGTISPMTITYQKYDSVTDTFNTVSNIINDVFDAITFLTTTVPNTLKGIQKLMNFAQGGIGGLPTGARSFGAVSSAVDVTTSELGFDATKPAGQQLTKWQGSYQRTVDLSSELGYNESTHKFQKFTDLANDEALVSSAVKDPVTGLANTKAIADGAASAAQAAGSAASSAASVASAAASTAAAAGSAAASVASSVGSAAGGVFTGIFGILAAIGAISSSSSTDGNGNTTYTTNTSNLQGQITTNSSNIANLQTIQTSQTTSITNIQTKDTAQDTFLTALVNAGYATFASNTYTLTDTGRQLTSWVPQILSALVSIGILTKTGPTGNPAVTTYSLNTNYSAPSSADITLIKNTLVDAGLLTKTTDASNNVTYSETSPIFNLLTQINSNTTNISTNTSNIATHTSQISTLFNGGVTAGFLTATTNNGVTTYAVTTNLQNIVTNQKQLGTALTQSGIITSTTTSGVVNYANIATNQNINANLTAVGTALTNFGLTTSLTDVNSAPALSNIAGVTTLAKINATEISEANIFSQVGLANATFDTNGFPTSYTIVNSAKNLVSNYFYGAGKTFNGGSLYLPPFDSLMAWWYVAPQFLSTLSAISQGVGISQWMAAFKRKGIGSAYVGNSNTNATTPNYNLQTSDSNVLSGGAEINTVNGGFLCTNFNLNSLDDGGNYTYWILFRPTVSTSDLVTSGSYFPIIGNDTGSTGYGVFTNQRGFYSLTGNGTLLYATKGAVVTGQVNNIVTMTANQYYFIMLTVSPNYTAGITNTYTYTYPGTGQATPAISGTYGQNTAYQLSLYINGSSCGTSVCTAPTSTGSILSVGCLSNTSSNNTTQPAKMNVVTFGFHYGTMAGYQISQMYSWIKTQYPGITLTAPY